MNGRLRCRKPSLRRDDEAALRYPSIPRISTFGPCVRHRRPLRCRHGFSQSFTLENTMKRTLLSLACIALLAACSAPQESQQQAAAPVAPPPTPAPATPPLASGIDLQYVDACVRAQDDFYRHVNGKWLDTFEIPADKPGYGAFTKVFDETQEHLHSLVDQAAQSAVNANPDQGKIGTLYTSFMDEAKLDELGAKPLAQDFAAIDALKDKKDVAALMGNIGKWTSQTGSFGPSGTTLPFVAYVHQDNKDSTKYIVDFQQSGIGLPDRD